ncbi:ankyrin repeat-containing domain protein [Mycena vitilis]|nr:ankyrin repeat-containing domain protein [Mycena vitilis]
MTPSNQAADNYAPIHLAAWRGNTKVLKLLVTHGIDVNSMTAHGWTALHLAAWTGHTEAVEFLVETKAQIQSVSHDDNLTALHLAAWKGHNDALQYLLQAGADMNRCSTNGVTALQLAVQNHQFLTAGLLLDIEGNIDIMVDTPIHSYHFPATPNL